MFTFDKLFNASRFKLGLLVFDFTSLRLNSLKGQPSIFIDQGDDLSEISFSF